MGIVYASIGVPRTLNGYCICVHWSSKDIKWVLYMRPLEFQGLNGYCIFVLWGLRTKWLLFMHPFGVLGIELLLYIHPLELMGARIVKHFAQKVS
jgi:hypothetical protein